MAERRMFSKTIIDSDAFLDMPLSAQVLYFHLVMNANDKGVLNNAESIVRCVNVSNTDVCDLLDRGYLNYGQDNELHITHWAEHCGTGDVQKKRNSYCYRKWRIEVIKRDNNTCQKCGAKNKLHAHHKKSFSKYPALRFVLENGVTLCADCHRKLHGLVKKEK